MKIRFHFFCCWTLAPTLAPRAPKLYKRMHRVILCTFWGCSSQDFWGWLWFRLVDKPINHYRSGSSVNTIWVLSYMYSNSTNIILLLTSVLGIFPNLARITLTWGGEVNKWMTICGLTHILISTHCILRACLKRKGVIAHCITYISLEYYEVPPLLTAC